MQNPDASPDPPGSGAAKTGQDVVAAVFVIVLMFVTGIGVCKAINGAVSGQVMVLTDRWGANPVVISALSPVWWIMLTTCTCGFCYCAYLLIQLIRNHDG